jgi:hypothetical protein
LNAASAVAVCPPALRARTIHNVIRLDTAVKCFTPDM